MANLRSVEKILQEQIDRSDAKWEYFISKIPPLAVTDEANLIKAISFVSSLTKEHVKLRWEVAPSNRITSSDPLHSFLLLSFADFRLRELKPTSSGEVQLAPARDSANYIARLLQTGIVLNETPYHFFGHSNSQLKSRSCFMFAAPKDKIAAKIEDLGDFSKLKSVGKKAKRIGLLFSTADMAAILEPERCEDINDVIRNDYTFTDGCGLISEQLARRVVQRRNIVYRNRHYLPSVFQIRYRGYKGVLTLCPKMKGKIQVQFRESMRKFKDVKDLSLSVVEYSKPYTFGYLNDEVVLLLHALGVTADTLLRKQTDFLTFLDAASKGDLRSTFQFLSYQSDTRLAEKFLMDGFEAVRSSVRSLIKQEYAKMLSKRGEQRCRIMIPKSRLLFGVCDPSGRDGESSLLKPGTCFVRVTLDGDGRAHTMTNTEVLVTRNPCLHPGDLQKFRVVDIPEWAHLVDCIVFSTSGSRPSADLMSGGDLDGDKFFVTWDPDLLPRHLAEPATYPGLPERIDFGKITNDDRAEFFAKYNNASLGRVKNLYLQWARLMGPMSAECQQLNRLFSQCVDGNRIRVPSILEDPPNALEDSEKFILDVLHDAAGAFIGTVVDKDRNMLDLPTDVVEFLTCRDSVAMSEFELIQLVLRRCDRGDCSFNEFVQFFDYSALSDEQQAWLLSRLPPSRDLPSLVKNGLCQSEMIHPVELHKFGLDRHNLRWKPVFTSTTDRMGHFLGSVSRSLELFHKKLIIFQADDRLTLMIYVPRKIPKASEIAVDTSVRVFALPRSSGNDSNAYRVMPTKVNYCLYCDDGVFQLYESHRRNTFIFLTRAPQNETGLSDIASVGDRRRVKQAIVEDGTKFDFIASVALNKIGSAIQQHVGRMNKAGIRAAEIYVISNRDVESMRLLDQWLEYVDTEKTLPLFEPTVAEYRVPTLASFDKSELPAAVKEVVWAENLSALQEMNLEQMGEVLKILHSTGQKTRLLNVYTELLQLAHANQLGVDTKSLLLALLNFLRRATFLTSTVLESALWTTQKSLVETEAGTILPDLLRTLILTTNTLRSFVKHPFLLVLQKLTRISIQEFAELVQLVALSVGQPEHALDLLMECMEPSSCRLLTGTPMETEQFVSCLTGIALDHIDEASASHKLSGQTLMLQHDGFDGSYDTVKGSMRIDSRDGIPKLGDHIRFIASGPPENAPLQEPSIMDAVVIRSDQGSVRLRCAQPPPPHLADCSWKYKNCGSFVTARAMFDAVISFYGSKDASCRLYGRLMVGTEYQTNRSEGTEAPNISETLNRSQNDALAAAMQYPLVLLWGPPGTGKTHTIVVILKRMLRSFKGLRFLVTAPTHNAVDNILQRFIDELGPEESGCDPLRVSTSLGKVSPALRKYTCDAMVGKDLSEGFAGHKVAQNRVKRSTLVFTTCVGSALGILRSEEFDVVLVDEASQQTQPETLIPLTKAANKHAVVSGFDVSLFEKLYTAKELPGVARVMLDTQYRMHPEICSFSSTEFYHNKLHTAEAMASIRVPLSQFEWPARKVFIHCESTEDLGHQSKSNQGQVHLCQAICKLLSSTPAECEAGSAGSSHLKDRSPPSGEIAILTPYTRQRELLRSFLSAYTISSIDGYQGREADIIIFVTVRSNAHREIGFLNDLRRLNVAMTRAKAGVIVIGDRHTLVGHSEEDVNLESKAVWRRLIDQCAEGSIPQPKGKA